MSSRSLGRAVTGGLIGGVGALLAASGLLRYPFVDRAVLGMPGPLLAIAGGLLLLVFGILFAIMPRRDLGPVPLVAAEVAFSQKPQTRSLAPPPLAPRPVPTPGAPSLPAHKPFTPVPPTPRNREPSLAQLDDEIQDLTRKINKAGVLLATGQLSTQGYQHYVGDLKKQRGKLEATRVKAELHKS